MKITYALVDRVGQRLTFNGEQIEEFDTRDLAVAYCISKGYNSGSDMGFAYIDRVERNDAGAIVGVSDAGLV